MERPNKDNYPPNDYELYASFLDQYIDYLEAQYNNAIATMRDQKIQLDENKIIIENESGIKSSIEKIKHQSYRQGIITCRRALKDLL